MQTYYITWRNETQICMLAPSRHILKSLPGAGPSVRSVTIAAEVTWVPLDTMETYLHYTLVAMVTQPANAVSRFLKLQHPSLGHVFNVLGTIAPAYPAKSGLGKQLKFLISTIFVHWKEAKDENSNLGWIGDKKNSKRCTVKFTNRDGDIYMIYAIWFLCIYWLLKFIKICVKIIEFRNWQHLLHYHLNKTKMSLISTSKVQKNSK